MHKIAFILLIVGGLNWGLTALVGGWDLANYVGATVAMVVYILVGVAALYEVFTHKGICRSCGS
jgi:uncharacterized membrane protein YuzA (DUF378 family)